MSAIKFSKDSELGKALFEWHQGLESRKGDRAMLRRAGNSIESSLSSYAYQLSYELKKKNEKVSFLRIPDIASVLAHIKEADPSKSLPMQLAQRREGADQPVFSELRFRRLLQCEDDDLEDLCRHLRRAIAMLKGKADIYTTANTIYWWNDRQRREWAYAYFGARAGLHTTETLQRNI